MPARTDPDRRSRSGAPGADLDRDRTRLCSARPARLSSARPARLAAAALLGAVLATGPARAVAADPVEPSRPAAADPAEPSRPVISASRRAAAIALALFPGVLVRGAGSWVVGERRTAKRLAATAAIGGAAAIAGAAPVGLTGSHASTIWPGVPLIVAGTGTFLGSWFADIWVAAGGAERMAAARTAPPWSLDLGTTWQHDAYRERALLGAAGHLELGRLGLDAAGLLDAGTAYRAAELAARWRLLGAPPTGAAVADGSRLLVRAAARVERDNDDRVTLATVEAELAARLDLARVDPALHGSFLELSAGGGAGRTSYPQDRHDLDAVLLAGFGFGAYLGDRGEAAMFYDHRRDGLAGGLAAARAAGFLGSFGARLELLVHGPWALRGQIQVGNAWVTTVGLRYLGGLEP